MNLLNISVRKTNGAKIKDVVILGHGYNCVKEWAIHQIEEHGPFPTPCTVEGFVYQNGDGWSKLESLFIPRLEK